MYLVAVKTLSLRCPIRNVVVVEDGTLADEDRQVLRRHIPGCELVGLSTPDTGRCPKGGTWERLALISKLARTQYVIQLDSDNIVCGKIPEVVAAYLGNRSFTLGTDSGRHIVSAAEASAEACRTDSQHVQILAERLLDKIDRAGTTRYVRGCSGFAGFARGFCFWELAESLSEKMGAYMGSKWNEWGSEQVGSNFVIANSPGSVVLPYPRYASFHPRLDWRKSDLLHFMGTYRFRRGIYRRAAAEAIRRLSHGAGL